MSENETELRALGRTVQGPMDRPAPELLERFRSPATDPGQNESGALLALRIDVPEFTSLCPITGQPDWARIVIRYQPHQWCVESKSLKLYLNSYRNFGEFHESCVNRICNDLVRLLDPHWVVVEGRFTPRGGIPFWPVALYRRSLRDAAPPTAGQSAAPTEQYDLLAPLTEQLDRAPRREDLI